MDEEAALLAATEVPVLDNLQPDHAFSCLLPLAPAMEDPLEAGGVQDASHGKTWLTDAGVKLVLELRMPIYSLPPLFFDDLPITSVPPRRKFVWVWSCVSTL